MKRNIFLRFLIVFLALTAFLVGYLVIRGDGPVSPQSKTGTILDKFDNNKQLTTSDPKLAEEEPFVVADRKVVSITNSPDKKGVIYFEKNTGKLFEFNFETKQELAISDIMLPNFMSAIWSPEDREAIGYFASNTSAIFKYLNTKTNQEVPLDQNIRSAAFSPTGDLIAYYYADPNNSPDISSEELDQNGLPGPATIEPNKIFIAQPDGTYPKKILNTRLEDIKLSWPTEEWLVFKTPASEIFLLNKEGGLNKFLESQHLLEEKWSRSGKKMLYSPLSDDMEIAEPVLWVKELDSRSKKYLETGGNASRCVWSIDDINIFCALAESPSADEIYLINTSDGSRKFIFDPETSIKELLLSSSEDYLLFVSASNERLYAIKISD